MSLETYLMNYFSQTYSALFWYFISVWTNSYHHIWRGNLQHKLLIACQPWTWHEKFSVSSDLKKYRYYTWRIRHIINITRSFWVRNRINWLVVLMFPIGRICIFFRMRLYRKERQAPSYFSVLSIFKQNSVFSIKIPKEPS